MSDTKHTTDKSATIEEQIAEHRRKAVVYAGFGDVSGMAAERYFANKLEAELEARREAEYSAVHESDSNFIGDDKFVPWQELLTDEQRAELSEDLR